MTSSIDLRLLRYFLTVAETENFTRAAERLGVTQPSVSQSILELEKALDAQMFRRLGKRLQLTEAGSAFRAGALVVVRKLEEACASVNTVAVAKAGHLDIGVVPALHLAWIPSVLQRLRVEYPGISITVTEIAARSVETEVEAGRIDLGLAILSHRSPNLRYERFLEEEFTIIVPKGHDLDRRTPVSLIDLSKVPLVLLPGNFDLRQSVDDMFERARIRPRVAYEINTLDSILATVAKTYTATILTPIVLAGREIRGLCAVPISSPVPRIEYGLITPRTGKASPAATVFLKIVRELLRSGR